MSTFQFTIHRFGNQEETVLRSSGYTPRRYLDVHSVISFSKDSKSTGSHASSSLDFTGTVKRVVKGGEGNHQSLIYFTCESGGLIKLQRHYDYDDFTSWKKWKIIDAEIGSVWRMRNVCVEGYDEFEGCANCVWRNFSELEKEGKEGKRKGEGGGGGGGGGKRGRY